MIATPSAFDPREFHIDAPGTETRKRLSPAEVRAWVGAAPATPSGIITALLAGGKMRGLCTVKMAASSSVICSVLSAMPAIPDVSTPGQIGISSDTSAIFGGAELVLKPFVSALPISRAALMGSSLDADLAGVFDAVFGAVLDKNVLAGDNAAFAGAFTAASLPVGCDVLAAAPGAPSIGDLVSLAGSLLAMGAGPKAAIVMHPYTYRSMLGNATSGSVFVSELLLKQTVLGVPVILSPYCPSLTTAGAYMAVAADWSSYGIGLAQEFAVDEISTVGSDNVTFQAFIYSAGRPLISGSFLRLKAV